jgi:hypothetical protein
VACADEIRFNIGQGFTVTIDRSLQQKTFICMEVSILWMKV